MPATTPARGVAQRLVTAIPAPVSACIGIVLVASAPVPDVTGVLEVDRALYAGKARGRSSVVFSADVQLPEQRPPRTS